MENANNINIHSLQEKAEKSEDNEAFQVLARIKTCRVGVGTRLESDENPSFFIEVLVSLCASNRSVTLDHIEKKTASFEETGRKSEKENGGNG
jgi:hypothetical protein